MERKMVSDSTKRCTKCGRQLELTEYYMTKDDKILSCCKECVKKYKRDRYAATRKKPDGTFYDAASDRCYVHAGYSKRILWNRRMTDDLCQMFATTPNQELADIIGVSVRTLIRKARELGLEKDPEWMAGVVRENARLGHFIAKRMGYPGCFKKGNTHGEAYRFKPGHVLTEEERRKQSESLRAAWKRRKIMGNVKNTK